MRDKNQSDYLRSYITKGWKTVDGWASPLLFERIILLDVFQKQLGIHGHIGEIGVHHGKLFTLLYLLRHAGEKGLAIDIFEEQELNVDNSGSGDRSIFVGNIQRLSGDTANLRILATDSTKISGADLCREVDGKLRLLSIDGGHLKNIVAHDLQTATQCLAAGGIVLVDDYLNPEFPGVTEGTLAFLTANEDLKPFCVSTQKLYLTTNGYEETYTRLLYEAETDKSFDGRIKYNFVAGRHAPVRIADLLGTEVLCYSDDEYDSLQQLVKRMARAKIDVRNRLSDSATWKVIRHSPIGALVKNIANRLLS